MTNEVNKLIWPSTNGIGLVDEAAWENTVDIALNTKNETGKTIITDRAARDRVHERVRAEGARRAGGRRRRREGRRIQARDVTLKEGGQ